MYIYRQNLTKYAKHNINYIQSSGCHREKPIGVGGYALFSQRAMPSDSLLGGDAMEYFAYIVIILVVATGYILSIKK